MHKQRQSSAIEHLRFRNKVLYTYVFIELVESFEKLLLILCCNIDFTKPNVLMYIFSFIGKLQGYKKLKIECVLLHV